MSNLFQEGEVLTAGKLNQLATEENPNFKNKVTLSSADGKNVFVFTATNTGLEVMRQDASTPILTIKNDGSVDYARKRLIIRSMRRGEKKTIVNIAMSVLWTETGTYRISDRGTLNGAITITGSNLIKVRNTGSAYQFMVLNSDGSGSQTWVNSNNSAGVLFYAISSCVVYFTGGALQTVDTVFDGSADVVCDLTTILTDDALAASEQEFVGMDAMSGNGASPTVLNITDLSKEI